MTKEEVTIIRRYYAGTVEALDEAEKAYNADKNNVEKREAYRYIQAKGICLGALCAELGVKLHDDNFRLIKEA